jgi:hypothetical protein
MLLKQQSQPTSKLLKSIGAVVFAFAFVVAVNPVAANARTIGSSISFSSVSLDYRSAYVSTGGSVANSDQPTQSFQWYKCSANTEFIAMVPPPTTFEGELVVVNSQAVIDGKLADAGCVVVAGKVDSSISLTDFYNSNGTLKDPSKRFVTAVTLTTPPPSIAQLPHSAIASGGYLRTSTNPVPGMSKEGNEYVSTDPTFNNGVGDPEISPTGYSWYACEEDVTGGFNLHEWKDVEINISDTGVAGCQKLFTSWEMGEGWMGTEVEGLRFEPAAGPVYTHDPANQYVPLAVNDVPVVIDLDGKYLVRTIDAYPYFGWSNGVKVGEEEEVVDPGTDGSGELADTGASTGYLAFAGLLGVAFGFVLLAISRRTRKA